MACLGSIICPNPIPVDKIPFSTACRSIPLLSMNDALAFLERKQIIRLHGEIKKKEREGGKKGKRNGKRDGRMKGRNEKRNEGRTELPIISRSLFYPEIQYIKIIKNILIN